MENSLLRAWQGGKLSLFKMTLRESAMFINSPGSTISTKFLISASGRGKIPSEILCQKIITRVNRANSGEINKANWSRTKCV